MGVHRRRQRLRERDHRGVRAVLRPVVGRVSGADVSGDREPRRGDAGPAGLLRLLRGASRRSPGGLVRDHARIVAADRARSNALMRAAAAPTPTRAAGWRPSWMPIPPTARSRSGTTRGSAPGTTGLRGGRAVLGRPQCGRRGPRGQRARPQLRAVRPRRPGREARPGTRDPPDRAGTGGAELARSRRKIRTARRAMHRRPACCGSTSVRGLRLGVHPGAGGSFTDQGAERATER